MANYLTKDGSNTDARLKATGTGTDLDPFVIQHEISTNGAIVSTTNPLLVRSVAQPGSASNTVSATNATATLTYAAAGSGQAHSIDGILCSLSADPTTAVTLTIQDGATTVMQLHITRGGAAPIFFPVRGTANTSMTISLTAGGTGIVGFLNAVNKRIVSA